MIHKKGSRRPWLSTPALEAPRRDPTHSAMVEYALRARPVRHFQVLAPLVTTRSSAPVRSLTRARTDRSSDIRSADLGNVRTVRPAGQMIRPPTAVVQPTSVSSATHPMTPRSRPAPPFRSARPRERPRPCRYCWAICGPSTRALVGEFRSADHGPTARPAPPFHSAPENEALTKPLRDQRAFLSAVPCRAAPGMLALAGPLAANAQTASTVRAPGPSSRCAEDWLWRKAESVSIVGTS